jgi:DNA repair protein RAD57
MLQQVLSTTFPSFVASNPGGRKIKLLVIDALGELFHSENKTTTSTLVERSKDILSISASLHELANQHKIAIVVLNEVIDVFDHLERQCWEGKDLFYDYQSRWFNTAKFFCDGKKQASLGLVWANQVNTRIILSRTGKRRHLNGEDLPKRLRLNNGNIGQSTDRVVDQGNSQPDLIRRLSVIFSNVTSPVSLEYIVSEHGICVLGDEDQVLWTADRADNEQAMQTGKKAAIEHPPPALPLGPKLPLISEVGKPSGKDVRVDPEPDEFEDSLWSTAESYENLDWDALEESLIIDLT